MRARVKTLPTSALAVLHRERAKHEAALVREVAGAAHALGLTVEAFFRRMSGHRAPWTITKHAQVMKALRAIGVDFGSRLSSVAHGAAVAGAKLGLDQQHRAIGILASAAAGHPVSTIDATPFVDTGSIAAHIDARTHDVGARAGAMVAQVGVSASYLKTKAPTPVPAVVVGLEIAELMALRAKNEAERVVVTEFAAGIGLGGDAYRTALAPRVPGMRKVWDATPDLRVCAQCADLHHTVVDWDEPFEGDLMDEPAHPRCRCATMVWMDDWSVLMDEAGLAPGPHAGVVGTVETRVASFTSPML